MYYVITKNSKLVAVCKTSPYAEDAYGGYSVHEFDDQIPDLNVHDWNSKIEQFERTDNQATLTKLQFLNKFTISERVQIMSSSDPVMKDIVRMFEAADYINLHDSKTLQAIGYFFQQGILTQDRYLEIIA